jgi:hypothetical protein
MCVFFRRTGRLVLRRAAMNELASCGEVKEHVRTLCPLMGDALARFVFAGTTSLAVVAGSIRGARAQEPCARLVVASSELPAGWAEVVGHLKQALAELPSTACLPLTLVVERADSAVRLTAETEDGRRAVRSVPQPSLLVPIALGLVVSVSPDAEEGATEPSHPNAATSPPAAGVTPPTASSSRTEPPPPVAIDVASRRVAVWLGITVGARIGVPSTVSMVEVGARADLRVEPLLLFVSFRNVPVGFVLGQGFDGDAYHESSIAFGVGRSVPLGPYVLDISVAPSLVTMRLSKDAPVHARADDAEFRVGVSARLNISLSPSWRFTVAADTDVIPDFLRSEDRIDPLPAFPSWTSGLSVGISGAVL